jgi:hypothetical protein
LILPDSPSHHNFSTSLSSQILLSLHLYWAPMTLELPTITFLSHIHSNMLLAGRSRVRFLMTLLVFLIDLILPQLHYGPRVDSACNKNEYQESSWGVKVQPARKADKFTATCKPNVYKNMRASTSHNPIGLHGRVQGYIYSLFYIQSYMVH